MCYMLYITHLKIIEFLFFAGVFNLVIGDKICHFITFHRSFNQYHDELNSFIKNLELNLDTVAKAMILTMRTQSEHNAVILTQRNLTGFAMIKLTLRKRNLAN